jgi:hypothetical protein
VTDAERFRRLAVLAMATATACRWFPLGSPERKWAEETIEAMKADLR